MDTVYIETTVVGHLTGRLLSNPIVASRQLTSRAWWSGADGKFKLYISQLVLDECGDGDRTAATDRLKVIEGIEMLAISADVDSLAESLMQRRAVPATEPRDAFHIAIAAVHGVQYMLTWNFKHIANASLRGHIEQVCRENGFEPPVICTPDELMGNDNGS